MTGDFSGDTTEPTGVITGTIARVVEYFVMVLIIGMMLLTVTDVFLRYAFNSPIFGGTEVTMILMLTVSCAGIILCTIIKGHIKVDLLGRLMPRTAQIISEGIFYLLGLGLFAFASWHTIPMAREQYRINAQSDLLDIPLFPFYLGLVITWALVAVVLLIFVIQNVIQVVRK